MSKETLWPSSCAYGRHNIYSISFMTTFFMFFFHSEIREQKQNFLSCLGQRSQRPKKFLNPNFNLIITWYKQRLVQTNWDEK